MGGTKEARNSSYSTTSTQIFAMRNLGGGWTIGTQPILQYNHKSDHWTVPGSFMSPER